MLRSPLVLVAAALLALSPRPAAASEWSRFRGPNGSGVSAATGLPVELGPEASLDWRTAVPFARSSPVVAGDRAFLTATQGDLLVTLAVDLASGEVLWVRTIGRDRTEAMYQGTDSATPSPATDGESVFAFFQEAGLVAYDLEGRELWQRPLGPFRNFYGIAASPVVAGDTVLQLCDQASGSFLIAVDKRDGRELWRRERTGRVESYTTPILLPDAEAPRQVLVSGSSWVDAYDLATGENAWSLRGVGVGPVASPVVGDGRLFVAVPDQAPEPPPPFAELLQAHDADGDGRLVPSEVAGTWMENHFGFVDHDADGALSGSDWTSIHQVMASDDWGVHAIRLPDGEAPAEVIWNHRQNVPYMPSPLLYRGVLYTVKDGIVSSLDPATGELLHRGRLDGGSPKVYASPVAADGKIYVATLDGKVVVLRAAAQWEVLAVNDLGAPIHATPAIAGGRLLVRTKEHLYSFSSPSPPDPAPAVGAGD